MAEFDQTEATLHELSLDDLDADESDLGLEAGPEGFEPLDFNTDETYRGIPDPDPDNGDTVEDFLELLE